MHYILLSIALNLGKENINYMKVSDMKNAKKLERTVNNTKNTEQIAVNDLPDNNSVVDSSFLNDEDFTVP